MELLVRIAVVAAFSVMVSGCGWFQPETEPIPAIRFGVLNSFPDFPCRIKTNGGNGRAVEPVPEIMLKDRMTRMAVQFLEDKGYEAVSVSGRTALASGGVDMLIEIVPGDILGIPAMAACRGYGFSEGRFPWESVEQPPRSFTGVQLVLSRGHSTRMIRTRPAVRFSPLTERRLGTWNGLSKEEKEHLEVHLWENTAKAVYLQLSRLKI